MCSQIIAFHTHSVAGISLEMTQAEAYHSKQKKILKTNQKNKKTHHTGLSCHIYKDIM